MLSCFRSQPRENEVNKSQIGPLKITILFSQNLIGKNGKEMIYSNGSQTFDIGISLHT